MRRRRFLLCRFDCAEQCEQFGRVSCGELEQFRRPQHANVGDGHGRRDYRAERSCTGRPGHRDAQLAATDAI